MPVGAVSAGTRKGPVHPKLAIGLTMLAEARTAREDE
jgi:hypothetical protein